MQSFTDILKSTLIKDSLRLLLNNDITCYSNNSGTSFPSDNLIVGMTCYRTDLKKRYILTDAGRGTWKECETATINDNVSDVKINNKSGYVLFKNRFCIQWGYVKSEDIHSHLYSSRTSMTDNRVMFPTSFQSSSNPIIIESLSPDNVFAYYMRNDDGKGFWLSDNPHNANYSSNKSKYSEGFSWIAIGIK